MQQCPSCGEYVPTEYVTCVWCGYDLTAEYIRRSGIKIGRKEAFQRIYGVIRNPVQAFKEITLIPEKKGGIMVLWFTGISITLHFMIILKKLVGIEYDTSPHYTASVLRNILAFLLGFIPFFIFIIFAPLLFLAIFSIMWWLATKIVVFLAKLVGGGSDKAKIRAVIGYSVAPVMVGWTVTVPLRLFAPKISVTSGSYQSIQGALTSINNSGIGIVIHIIIILSWLWTLAVAYIGIKRASNLSVVEAVIVAGIPYGLLLTQIF